MLSKSFSEPSTFLFLGTGASLGTPALTCSCPVCRSTSPYNRRLRSAAVVSFGGQTLLIDAGPDFKQQALLYNIEKIDALLITHTHYDHIAGLDELRPFFYQRKKAIPCILSAASYAELNQRYHYLFHSLSPHYPPPFQLQLLKGLSGEHSFASITFGYFSYKQGNMEVTGFRFGSLAYVTDIHRYEPSLFTALQGVETLIISAARFTPSSCHLSFDEAICLAETIGAAKTYFTHIAHDTDHEEGSAYLPQTIELAYDGLKIDFNASFSRLGIR